VQKKVDVRSNHKHGHPIKDRVLSGFLATFDQLNVSNSESPLDGFKYMNTNETLAYPNKSGSNSGNLPTMNHAPHFHEQSQSQSQPQSQSQSQSHPKPYRSAQDPADLNQSNDQYAALSKTYDQSTPRLERFRNEAHAFLQLEKGMTVVDMGCGTGKSLGWLADAVGPEGRVIGIEPSEAMLGLAQQRVAHAGWQHVALYRAPASALMECVAPASVDAFLLMFTHDVLQSDAAIADMLTAAKPGARFALAGGKFYSGLLSVMNPWVERRQRAYCTTFEGYDAPWRKLFASPRVTACQSFDRYLGIAYVAQCFVR
jgi:ubiquinone/menaquinone biosynthesis C-methylase UbiE